MMKGGNIAGLLIRQARLRLNWSQEGLCRGICAPSYLSKIEQGKVTPSPEVTELLFRRLGLVWKPEPESLQPCWKALLSGSPDFASCYERLVQPRQEILACSPLAADCRRGDVYKRQALISGTKSAVESTIILVFNFVTLLFFAILSDGLKTLSLIHISFHF